MASHDLDSVCERMELPRYGSLRPVRDWRSWWREQGQSDELAAIAGKQGFVVRTSELAGHGVTRSQARWAVRQQTWLQPARGVVAPVDIYRDLPQLGAGHVLDRRRHALRGSAAVLVRGEEISSDGTAAIMLGLPTMAVPDRPSTVSLAPRYVGRRSTTHSHDGRLEGWQTTSWFGAPVTTVARTLVDLGRADGRDALMAADAALREGVVDVEEIESSLAFAARWPGVARARQVLKLADPRAESPLESIVRLALHDDGFPPPQLQVWLGGDRVDFFWPDRRLVLEADGRDKYTGEERWAEKKREQRLRRSGADVIERVTWYDATAGWPATRDVLRRLLA